MQWIYFCVRSFARLLGLAQTTKRASGQHFARHHRPARPGLNDSLILCLTSLYKQQKLVQFPIELTSGLQQTADRPMRAGIKAETELVSRFAACSQNTIQAQSVRMCMDRTAKHFKRNWVNLLFVRCAHRPSLDLCDSGHKRGVRFHS